MTIDSAPPRPRTSEPATKRPGRLVLRRRLLLWSAPLLVLLVLLAVKLASVGVLGNHLPAQFAARDASAMESTLGWIDIGSFGRGAHESLAGGDLAMLNRDAPAALDQFKTAHDKDPAACAPRGNYALTAELVSDGELRRGNFIKARTLLEAALQTAGEDRDCFATSPATDPTIKTFVTQTPDRLALKLKALKAGAITQTPEGYDYLRAPGGNILDLAAGQAAPCPFTGQDDAALRTCIKAQDDQRNAQLQQAQQQEDQSPPPDAPPPPPNAPPPPPPPPNAPPPPAQAPADPEIEFPSAPKQYAPDPNGDVSLVPFCDGNGTPLGDLGSLLCNTSGPLP